MSPFSSGEVSSNERESMKQCLFVSFKLGVSRRNVFSSFPGSETRRIRVILGKFGEFHYGMLSNCVGV